jgi:hypothetical protein
MAEGRTLFDGGSRGDLLRTGRMVDLCLGAPGPETLREVAGLFQRAAAACAAAAVDQRGAGEQIFQYGPATGLPEYKEALAKILSQGVVGFYFSQNFINKIVE